MLAPVTEAEWGEEALLELGLRALEAWARAPYAPLVRATGTMVVARDPDAAAGLERLHDLHLRLGLPVRRLLPSAARRVEPALAPTVRLALEVPGDRAVDPRALVARLREELDVRAPAPVAAVSAGGVRLADGTELAGRVVVAAGVDAGRLTGLPVRAVKGQVLRLRGEALVERSIRTEHAYLVPRGDGRFVLGATMEERSDNVPTAGGVYELIREIAEVIPGVLELELESVTAGLRPMTPDNRPVIGERAGVLVAAGHGRNGILLAPLTGDLVAGLLAGEGLPAWAGAADPARFVEAPAR